MDLSILIQQIISPLFVLLATQGVKKASLIPINQGQTARVRSVAAILSFGSALLVAFANGNLEGFLTPDMINVGVNGLITFVLAHVGYKAVVKPLDI